MHCEKVTAINNDLSFLKQYWKFFACVDDIFKGLNVFLRWSTFCLFVVFVLQMDYF